MATTSGYRELAVAVIQQAVRDFTDTRVNLKTAIDAGAFLVERKDEMTRLWFGLAGICAPDQQLWRVRLAELRARKARN